MNEEDKRVIRTRSRLAGALIKLSCAKGYDAVTVQDITERAGINYRTFYRHYESKDDLLRDVLRTIMADLWRVMPPPTPADIAANNYEEIARRNARTLYEYVAENSDIFQVLLQSGPAVLDPIKELAKAQAEAFLVNLPLGDVPYQLVAHHIIVSSFSLVQWWLTNDMSHSPEQMGDYAAQLIMLPIRELLVENGVNCIDNRFENH